MKAFVIVGVLLVGLGGCATHRGAGLTPDEQAWDAMNQCAKDAGQKPIRERCEKLFKETSITAVVRDLRINYGSIDLDLTVSQTDYGARYLSCSLEGAKYRAPASALKRGDRITVRGVLMNAFESPALTDLVLRPCELVSGPIETKK